MIELKIVDLAKLQPGRIFYSGRLYVVEVTGSASKARLWGSAPGTSHGCVTLSKQSMLARFYPVLERGVLLPMLKRVDFLLKGQPMAYTFETEAAAHMAAQLDADLTPNSGLGLQRRFDITAWLLTDGANPYRVYHYSRSDEASKNFATYCVQHRLIERHWPDEYTPHWKMLFDAPADADVLKVAK